MAGILGPAVESTSPLSNREKSALLTAAMTNLTPDQFGAKLATASILPIARQMIEKSFARKIFQVDRIDGPAAIYQSKRRQVAVTIAKYGGAPTRIHTYPRQTVVPYYIMVKPEVELSDLLDAQFDAAADILADAGAEMAVKEDSEFLRIFASVAALPVTSTTTVVPTVAAGPGNIGYVLNTNVYQVGTAVSGQDVITAGDPSLTDIVKVQNLLRSIGYDPDTILLHPDGLGRLNAQKAFLYYLNFGTREVQETGYTKSALGNRIVWSQLVPQKTAYVFDTYELARFVERESLTVKPEFYELRAKWLVYERISPFCRNANALIRMVWNVPA